MFTVTVLDMNGNFHKSKTMERPNFDEEHGTLCLVNIESSLIVYNTKNIISFSVMEMNETEEKETN